MNNFLLKASHFFEIPLDMRSRILILVAALVVLPTLFFPLWRMTLYSNQFRDGLTLKIYSHKLEGGKTPNRDDLKEINSLNHYIGMRPLQEEDFTEFLWIPFVLGALMLLSLRAAVLGKMSKLIDVLMLFTYFGLFSLWSFYYKLYQYGHNLEPDAAIKVPPFTPPMIGHQTMANFEVYSYPDVGSLCMAVVPALFLLAVWLSKKTDIQIYESK